MTTWTDPVIVDFLSSHLIFVGIWLFFGIGAFLMALALGKAQIGTPCPVAMLPLLALVTIPFGPIGVFAVMMALVATSKR